jgi:hypothetical protein
MDERLVLSCGLRVGMELVDALKQAVTSPALLLPVEALGLLGLLAQYLARW